MEIQDIRVDAVNINPVKILDIRPIFTNNYPLIIPKTPPVTIDIGVPIVNIPGCVEAHLSNNPKNTKIQKDDEFGTVVLCDGKIPSYNPIDYDAGNIKLIDKQKIIPPVKPSTPDIPKTPNTSKVLEDIPLPRIECPTLDQRQNEPVGFIFDFGRQKVIGYQLQGNECVRLSEEVAIPEQVINALPATGQVVTTATIAIVATTSALLAKPLVDLLLKVIRPLTKKIVKKIASVRGREVGLLSVSERRIEQRERNHAIYALRQTFKVGKNRR